ncbi:septation protein SepH [Neomicrococcus aestuarii]|uniref:DUF3071 domain-containing protein n=1 Tax=Neomicrococcus aestuarii TaxID=556325 RepID=A0A1L2ZK53_9MICC|nr:septation protein SepH [Neomicrococcus aestuarii]APF39773.1 hypothetical protein BHE16_00645 [Neomicrococcus aestuarii]
MTQLRLVGIHEEGNTLLLSGDDGATFELPIDEALRAAISRAHFRSHRGENDAPLQLTPREIQGRIRSGMSAEEVAAESGLTLAHILKYEGPVRAERDHVARMAQAVEVSAPSHSETYRAAFGDEPATLGSMVEVRLRQFGIDTAEARWDAWRLEDGQWEVTCDFDTSSTESRVIGEEPPARWIFHATHRTLMNKNRWAQVLGELETVDHPGPVRRLSAVQDNVFDVEASEQPGRRTAPEPSEQEELLEVLRQRRGQRLGADEDADDALALMLSKGSIPAAHPRNPALLDEDENNEYDDAASSPVDSGKEEAAPVRNDRLASVTRLDRASRSKDSQPAEEPQKAEETSKDATEESHPKNKRRRSSVPSWDEIVFGKKDR